MKKSLIKKLPWTLFIIVSLEGPLMALADEMVEIPAGADLYMDSFFIDRFEVTNEDFAKVIREHDFHPGAEDHPATHVTFEEADRFCRVWNKRLPKGDEWEKAARGTDGRMYPWGNKPLKQKPHPFFSGIIKRKVGFNKKDRSPYGVRDMASSVWEWTVDSEDGKKLARGGLWNLHLDYEYSKTYDHILVSPNSRFIYLGFRCVR